MAFFTELDYVIENSKQITDIITNISNEVNVGNGKLDHILFKLLAYNTFLNDTHESLIDENSCRFGKWFEDVAKKVIQDDTKTINDVSLHHRVVHQKAKEAVKLWGSGKYLAAIENMQKVEHASDVGFKELYQSFMQHRK